MAFLVAGKPGGTAPAAFWRGRRVSSPRVAWLLCNLADILATSEQRGASPAARAGANHGGAAAAPAHVIILEENAVATTQTKEHTNKAFFLNLVRF